MTTADPCAIAFEASTDRFGIAACRGGAVRAWAVRPARDGTQQVYVHAARLLAELDAGFADLDMVAFGCGPGSFTGVRVAAAAAQALAFAHDLPVCRVSSLAVLAAGALREAPAPAVAVCLDARMERAYAALYRPDGAGGVVPEHADALVDPATFAFPGGAGFLAAGPGWDDLPALAERHRGRITALRPDILPDARDLLAMALADLRAGRTVAAEAALPEYLGQVPALPRGAPATTATSDPGGPDR